MFKEAFQLMRTTVSTATKQVVIGHDLPTVLIGERINPTGKARLSAALQAGDLELVRQLAISQVEDGADILDVNVGASGVDEVALLPRAVQAVTDAVDVPLCIDSSNPSALIAAMKVYRGKPIINSVDGQEGRLSAILPLVKDYGAVVIGLTMDDDGIPKDADRRVAIAGKIIQRAEALGIARENIVIDCLALTLGAESKAGLVTLEAVRRVRDEFGVNQTIGASNISFGLPDRDLLNGVFLALAIAHGVTCPVVNAARVRPAILAADLVLGRDEYAVRYIRAYRKRQAKAAK
jgi:5-methyltetrahydrofolate--homocysteine methyltransferase